MAASAVGLLCLLIAPSQANALPPNFTETTALSGLTAPTVVRFASDGRVLVAEKSGLVQMFSGLGDPTPETVVDLRTNVYDFADHGLLGMALDPGFAANNRIYVGYTHDAPIGDTAPVWDDDCPNPEEEGCPVSVRVSRITLSIGDPTPPEDWVIEDWCQQYSSHSIGSLEFGSDGALYASGGEGASFQFADWGQNGNPCGDPPNQGGALRSQDLRTTGDPVGLGGTVIRVDPATGAGLPGNPNGGSSNANTRRIIAQGLRNPFRFAISPGNELWIGDVGWNTWEELNRMPRNPPSVVNFGWPCYEGSERQEDYDDADLSICENLYTDAVNPATGPAFAYQHDTPVIPGESCPTFASSLAGVDFYEGGPFPAAYEDALFFADFTRDCIWVIRAGAGGSPDPATLSTFHTTASNPTFLQTGPGGALYYTDIIGGRVQRIGYANQPPTAAATASPANGREPLTVAFDGTRSGDLEGPLAYDWDLDGDGRYDDSTAPAPQRTYDAGAVTIGLRVVDDEGVAATATVPVNVAARQDPPLRLFKLRLFIPESVDQLIKRGGRAKLKCNLDCRVTMKLVAKGGRAKAIGIDGTIARQVKSLDANDPTEVVAKLRKRAVRRLEKSGRDRAPRVVPKFKARAR